MAGRIRAATPVGSCPDCLSWGASYGSQSYCRACYDFTRRYGRGQCAGCRRVIAVKKGHCRLCWLQAGIAAAGRRRLTPADFAGSRILAAVPGGHEPPGQHRPGPAGPAGRSRPAGRRVRLDPAAAERTRRIAALRQAPLGRLGDHRPGPGAGQAHRRRNLAAARGWNDRIITETSRALAVVLAGYQPGDMIAWSQLPAALHRRDLSITRTAEILGLAGLLDDDRIPSFTSLAQERLALLPAPMAAGVRDWLRTRSQGGPRSRPRDEHTVRMNFNRVHPLLLAWAGHTSTCARSPPPTSSPPPGRCTAACAGRPSPPCARCSATPRRPARSSATPPAASATASVP